MLIIIGSSWGFCHSHLHWHRNTHSHILWTHASLHHHSQFYGVFLRPAGDFKSFSLHSLSLNSFRTTLSHHSLLCNRIQNPCVVRGGINTGTLLMHSRKKKESLEEHYDTKVGKELQWRDTTAAAWLQFCREAREKETTLQCGNLHMAPCKQEFEYNFYCLFK